MGFHRRLRSKCSQRFGWTLQLSAVFLHNGPEDILSVLGTYLGSYTRRHCQIGNCIKKEIRAEPRWCVRLTETEGHGLTSIGSRLVKSGPKTEKTSSQDLEPGLDEYVCHASSYPRPPSRTPTSHSSALLLYYSLATILFFIKNSLLLL